MSLATSNPVTGLGESGYGRAGGPYQATAALMSGLVAATWYTVEPPQHQPVTPTRSARTPGCFFAHSPAAATSPSSCLRGTARTIFRMSWTFGICPTPPSRWNSSGATAQYPALAKRRVQSLTHSCTPQISERTSTMGKLLPEAGRAAYTGML